jgi:hypothetical protein
MVYQAEVAKLADALDSGSSGGNPMGVQLPPSAPVTGVSGPFFFKKYDFGYPLEI